MLYHFVLPGFRGGFLGVDVFFVLSGFLITSLLLEEHRDTGTVSLLRFYARRMRCELLPAMLVVLAVTLPLVPRVQTLQVLLYVGNWTLPLGSAIRHLWSLGVEEQFYIVWPLLLLALLRARVPRAAIGALVVTLALGSTWLKIAMWRSPADWVRLYSGTDTRADQLLVGCAVALLLAWSAWPRRAWFRALSAVALWPALALLGALLLNSAVYWEFFYRQAGFLWVALAAAAIVLRVMLVPDGGLARVLAWGPLPAIGRISYGLYLWHQPVAWCTDPRKFEWVPILGRWEQLVLRVALSFAFAGLSFWLVERPMLRLKHRFEAAGRAAAPAA